MWIGKWPSYPGKERVVFCESHRGNSYLHQKELSLQQATIVCLGSALGVGGGQDTLAF